MQTKQMVKQCVVCFDKEKQLLRCTRCKNVYYCGVQCQKKDWAQHKLKCSKVVQGNTQPQPAKKAPKQQNNEGINQFEKLQHIGTGNFSTIFKGISKTDGKTYAIKQAQKAKLSRVRKQADLFMEKHCLSKLKQCPYVVRLWKTFQDPLHLFLQMECPENGQLWQQSKFFGIIGQSTYKYFACHLLKAISTLHEKYEIVHRDLKPENILLNSKNQIKLIDFGTAKDLSRPDIKGSGNGLKGRKPFEHYVGTPNYMAPECIHNRSSDKISDVYSLCGVLYHLKVGSAPFAGGSEYIIFTKSLNTEIFLCPELFSPSLSNLMWAMNKKQVSERLPLSKVFEHEYFEGVDFQNLPTYEQVLAQMTPLQCYVYSKCQQLIQKFSKVFKEPIQKKNEIYRQQILPYLQKLVEQGEWKEELLKKVQILKIQLQLMINLKEDTNIGFTQLYKEHFNIIDPVVVPQIQECQEQEQNELVQDFSEIKISQPLK